MNISTAEQKQLQLQRVASMQKDRPGGGAAAAQLQQQLANRTKVAGYQVHTYILTNLQTHIFINIYICIYVCLH